MNYEILFSKYISNVFISMTFASSFILNILIDTYMILNSNTFFSSFMPNSSYLKFSNVNAFEVPSLVPCSNLNLKIST